jgi:molybdopterin/thiamine biosynthesis adenylyltransferase
MQENVGRIFEAMVASGFTQDRRCTKGMLFRGNLRVHHLEIAVEILFQDASFSRLPKLRLVDPPSELQMVIGHLDDEGFVCYAQEIELQLDPYLPREEVARCLNAMAHGLFRMLRDDLSKDIEQEFPQHWLGEIRVHVAEQWTKSGDAFLFTVKRPPGEILVLGRDRSCLRRFTGDPREQSRSERTARKVRVVRVGKPLTFAKGFSQPKSVHELLKWAGSIEAELDGKILGAFEKQPFEAMHVFLAAPNGLVGAVATPSTGLVNAQKTAGFVRYAITQQADRIQVTRITGYPADEQFVIDRNLAGQQSLAGKKICIVGLGTIGSHVSKLACQAGAGHLGGLLMLVDYQYLTAGNVGRHLLGLEFLNVPKVVGCRDFLKTIYPSANVRILNESVLRNLDVIADYDLIIDATGDEPTSTNINHHFVRHSKSGSHTSERLHVWLEGNGVAARAMFVGSGGACLECLNHGGGERFPTIRQGHVAEITPAHCGEGAYFAYGPAAPAIAAGLAIQMALDWAKGEPSPRLRTIRIIESATRATKDQNPPPLSGCRCCAS